MDEQCQGEPAANDRLLHEDRPRHADSCASHPGSHLHRHSHLPRDGDGHTSVLAFVLITITILTVAQLVVSVVIRSLVLFIDAVDATTDVAGYGMNLYAEWYGQQQGSLPRQRIKLEVTAATFATICTVALSIWTIYDAAMRLAEGADRDLELGWPMVGFSGAGLIVNVIALVLFKLQGIPSNCTGEHGELNLCSALLHLVGDAVRALVIFVSGLYITITDSPHSGEIDAWCAIFVSVFTLALVVPVMYGIVLTIKELGKEENGSSSDPSVKKFEKLNGKDGL